jgi:phosphoribosyl 1,2-cyclic phosphate phosphodiesterase
VFIHGPNILIDMPEESAIQLARARISEVHTCLFTHWHPDHTQGLRALEMNMDWLQFRPKGRTLVHVFPHMRETFISHYGIWDRLQYLQEKGLVEIKEHAEATDVTMSNVTITPLPLPFYGAYGYLLTEGGKRAVVCLDEVKGWEPPSVVHGADLAILPLGVVAKHPLTGKGNLSETNPLLTCELSWEEALALGERIRAKRTIYIHLSEPDDISVNEFAVISRDLSERYGRTIEFGFDTQRIRFEG